MIHTEDNIYNNPDKSRAQYYMLLVAEMDDFLEWLFDTELEYTNQPEMWAKFEEFKNTQNETTNIKGVGQGI